MNMPLHEAVNGKRFSRPRARWAVRGTLLRRTIAGIWKQSKKVGGIFLSGCGARIEIAPCFVNDFPFTVAS